MGGWSSGSGCCWCGFQSACRSSFDRDGCVSKCVDDGGGLLQLLCFQCSTRCVSIRGGAACNYSAEADDEDDHHVGAGMRPLRACCIGPHDDGSYAGPHDACLHLSSSVSAAQRLPGYCACRVATPRPPTDQIAAAHSSYKPRAIAVRFDDPLGETHLGCFLHS